MPRSRKRKRKQPVKSMSSGSTLPREMQDALDSFSREAEGIVDLFARKIDAGPTPTLIYHYRNDTGLRGIIESGKLWFTNIFYLNDPSELRHGVSPAIEMLTAEYDDARPEIEKFTLNLAAVVRGSIKRTAHYFVCSFSTDGDELGQWRAYPTMDAAMPLVLTPTCSKRLSLRQFQARAT
jgi:hypothetical protein